MSRPNLIQRLKNLLLSTNLVEAIASFHEAVLTRLKLMGKLSSEGLSLYDGILQGSPISVTLFGLLLDTIGECLEGGDFD